MLKLKAVLAGVAACAVLPGFAVVDPATDGAVGPASTLRLHDPVRLAGTADDADTGRPTLDFGSGPITLSPATDVADNRLWRLYTATFPGTGPAMSPTFGALHADDAPGASAQAADADALTVSEPASLAMLGAVLLGFLSLQRHRGRAR